VKKFIIKVSGKEYEVEVEEVKQEGVVSQAISEVKEVIPNTVKSAAPATSSMPANNNNKAPIGAETIDAPMPGVILDVKVKEGGQQQRVSIARALITKPAIVLADEPTGNLDSRTSSDVLGLIKRTSSKFNQTIVIITHNTEIAQLADRIIRIEDGRIIG
jgi:ABC-type glutathione transport system ATPase component